MTKYNTHEAQISFPIFTSVGMRANGLHESLKKDIIETFSPIDGYGHGSFVYYEATTAKKDHKNRLELSGVIIYEIRHHMKANAALKKLVKDYMERFGIQQMTYSNFSNEFETVSLVEDIDEEVEVAVKTGGNNEKSINKK